LSAEGCADERVRFTRPGDRRDVLMRLEPGILLRGFVRDRAGRGVDGLTVEWADRIRDDRQTTTRDGGYFELHGRGFDPVKPTRLEILGNRLPPMEVSATPGELVQVTLPDFADLRVRVETDEVASNLSVTWQPLDLDPSAPYIPGYGMEPGRDADALVPQGRLLVSLRMIGGVLASKTVTVTPEGGDVTFRVTNEMSALIKRIGEIDAEMRKIEDAIIAAREEQGKQALQSRLREIKGRRAAVFQDLQRVSRQ
jgi:hypothetical protein